MQTALTWTIVLACAAHATWLLMPTAGRRALANVLAKLMGRPVSDSLAPGARAQADHGCSGCAGGCGPRPTARAAAQPITLHRRRPATAPAGAAPEAR